MKKWKIVDIVFGTICVIFSILHIWTFIDMFIDKNNLEEGAINLIPVGAIIILVIAIIAGAVTLVVNIIADIIRIKYQRKIFLYFTISNAIYILLIIVSGFLIPLLGN